MWWLDTHMYILWNDYCSKKWRLLKQKDILQLLPSGGRWSLFCHFLNLGLVIWLALAHWVLTIWRSRGLKSMCTWGLAPPPAAGGPEIITWREAWASLLEDERSSHPSWGPRDVRPYLDHPSPGSRPSPEGPPCQPIVIHHCWLKPLCFGLGLLLQQKVADSSRGTKSRNCKGKKEKRMNLMTSKVKLFLQNKTTLDKGNREEMCWKKIFCKTRTKD